MCPLWPPCISVSIQFPWVDLGSALVSVLPAWLSQSGKGVRWVELTLLYKTRATLLCVYYNLCHFSKQSLKMSCPGFTCVDVRILVEYLEEDTSKWWQCYLRVASLWVIFIFFTLHAYTVKFFVQQYEFGSNAICN